MGRFSRTPDYIASHQNLVRRVSNLETGVHPTRANIEYWDSKELTSFPLSVSQNMEIIDASWQRRAGIVFFYGQVLIKKVNTLGSNGTRLCNLPDAASPNTLQHHFAALSGGGTAARGYLIVQIKADGEFRVMPALGSGSASIWLSSISYPWD